MSVHRFRRYVTHGTTGVSNPLHEVVLAEDSRDYTFDEDEERPVSLSRRLEGLHL